MNSPVQSVPSGQPAGVPRSAPGGPGGWLHGAAAGLLALAGAAAIVSFTAQYRLVFAARGIRLAAALEAAIPDAAALVFACLGVALALHGRHAVRARLLNAASAGTSLFMNVIAAAPGWRDVAVWAMPPAAYALASDTLIGVVRVRVAPGRGAAEDVGMLSVAGGLVLWLLRLCVAPASTLAGFRAWVLAECPVAPGRRAPAPAPAPAKPPPAEPPPADPALVLAALPRSQRGSAARDGTKTARFLALVIQQYGPLAQIPVPKLSRISAVLAPQVGLHPGSARAALRRAVLAEMRDGGLL